MMRACLAFRFTIIDQIAIIQEIIVCILYKIGCLIPFAGKVYAKMEEVHNEDVMANVKSTDFIASCVSNRLGLLIAGYSFRYV